jgi:hypothetical protein
MKVWGYLVGVVHGIILRHAGADMPAFEIHTNGRKVGNPVFFPGRSHESLFSITVDVA